MARNDSLFRVVIVVLAGILLLPLVLMATMLPVLGMWGRGYAGDGMGGLWFWLLPWLGLFLIVLLLGYVLYRVLGGDSDGDRALEELREAYARGDLSTEEFDERRERLRPDE